MDIVSTDLAGAAGAARDRLAALSRDAAVANAGLAAKPAGGAMAAAAGEAIFTDALLGALHARLEELKNVARS